MRDFNTDIQFYEFDVKLGLGITFPSRSTIIKLGDRKALVVSPGPFDDATRDHLKSQFDTITFASPNAFHHLFLARTKRDFPQSQIFAPAGAIKKQQKMGDSLTPIGDLKNQLNEQIKLTHLEGNPTLDEYSFWHAPSKTLILTDLFFNMREPMPRSRRWILKLTRAYNKVGKSKIIALTTKDKVKFRAAIQQLIDLEPESIVVAHGEPITGAEQCKKALSEL